MIGVHHPLSKRPCVVRSLVKDVVHGKELGELAQVILTALVVESTDWITDLGGQIEDITRIDESALAIDAIIKDQPDVRIVKVCINVELNAIDEVIVSPGELLQR